MNEATTALDLCTEYNLEALDAMIAELEGAKTKLEHGTNISVEFLDEREPLTYSNITIIYPFTTLKQFY